jgi:hypothetical protein
MTTTYDVTVRRDGRLWYVEIPALDGATQARTLSEVDVMARDYIANVLEVSESAIELEVHLELPGNVTGRLRHAAQLRDAEAKARSEAADEIRAAARELRAAGLTMREIGTALGVSYQRAHQLVSA